jgi:hypothetical protein
MMNGMAAPFCAVSGVGTTAKPEGTKKPAATETAASTETETEGAPLDCMRTWQSTNTKHCSHCCNLPV